MNKFEKLTSNVTEPPKVTIKEIEDCDESSIIKSFMVRTNKKKNFLILQYKTLNNKENYIAITKEYIKNLLSAIREPINDKTFNDTRPKTGDKTENQYLLDFINEQPDINDLIHGFPQENHIISAYHYIIFNDVFAIKLKFIDGKTKILIFPEIICFYLKEYLENSVRLINQNF